MPKHPHDSALRAFIALRSDVEQFDDHPLPPDAQGLFSERVPLYMKGYLVNWLRNFTRDHGDLIEAVLKEKSERKE